MINLKVCISYYTFKKMTQFLKQTESTYQSLRHLKRLKYPLHQLNIAKNLLISCAYASNSSLYPLFFKFKTNAIQFKEEERKKRDTGIEKRRRI